MSWRISGDFIGLDNFQRMFFEDRRYWRSVNATLKYVIFSVPLRLVFALAVAMLLNTYRRRGVGVYRAAFYAPFDRRRQHRGRGDVARDLRQ